MDEQKTEPLSWFCFSEDEFYFFFVLNPFHVTSAGDARKIDENVAAMIPTVKHVILHEPVRHAPRYKYETYAMFVRFLLTE